MRNYRLFRLRTDSSRIGGDGVVELDQSCRSALAKDNLVLATLFAVLLLLVREVDPAQAQSFLLVENGVLAVVFGAIQTYCWISR